MSFATPLLGKTSPFMSRLALGFPETHRAQTWVWCGLTSMTPEGVSSYKPLLAVRLCMGSIGSQLAQLRSEWACCSARDAGGLGTVLIRVSVPPTLDAAPCVTVRMKLNTIASWRPAAEATPRQPLPFLPPLGANPALTNRDV